MADSDNKKVERQTCDQVKTESSSQIAQKAKDADNKSDQQEDQA